MKLLRLTATLLALTAAFNAQAADKVKIGMLTTLSGAGAGLGVDIRDGFDLALTHLGNKMGNLPVEVLTSDDQQNPDVAKQMTERLLKKEKVDFMTGVVFSNVMLAVGPSVFAAKTHYVSANAGPSQYAGAQCSPFFFNVAWQNDNLDEAVGKMVTEQGFKNVLLLAPNYPGGKDNLNGFKRTYKGKVVDEIYTKMGQLDYGAELAQIRSAKPDAVFIFLPGGMGINFIKQFADSGLSKTVQLFGPGFSADEDIIKAVGEPMIGMRNASQWGHDMDNPQNKRFVADFLRTYKRMPSLYASQGYDAAMLIDSAVRGVNGKLDNKAAVTKALKAANFKSVRGDFKFNNNHYPVQDYYARVIEKNKEGRVTNRTLAKVLSDHGDVYAKSCKM